MKSYEQYWLIAGLFFGIIYGTLIGSIAFINFEITKNIAEISSVICDLITVIIGFAGIYIAMSWKKQLIKSREYDQATEIKQNLNYFTESLNNFSFSIKMYINSTLDEDALKRLDIQSTETLEAWRTLYKSLIKHSRQANLEELKIPAYQIQIATKLQRHSKEDIKNIKKIIDSFRKNNLQGIIAKSFPEINN